DRPRLDALGGGGRRARGAEPPPGPLALSSGGPCPPVRSPAAPRARAHEARHPLGGTDGPRGPPGARPSGQFRKAVRSVRSEPASGCDGVVPASPRPIRFLAEAVCQIRTGVNSVV